MTTAFFIYLIGFLLVIFQLYAFIYTATLDRLFTDLSAHILTNYLVYHQGRVYPIHHLGQVSHQSAPIVISSFDNWNYNYGVTIYYRSRAEFIKRFYGSTFKHIFLKDQLAQLYPEALL